MVEGQLSNDCVKPSLLRDNGRVGKGLGTFYPHEPLLILRLATKDPCRLEEIT